MELSEMRIIIFLLAVILGILLSGLRK